jgi:GH25 family lysozyme M1 (1,4-beta-N-acetylmuramidase)
MDVRAQELEATGRVPGRRARVPIVLCVILVIGSFGAAPTRADVGGASPPGAGGRIVDPNAPAWAHASAGAMSDGEPRARAPSTSLSDSWLPGIDVSHWNGTIDWMQVAESGRRFVIMKATDGRSYVDPTYATNKAGAAAAGLAVGAYHYARPDTTEGDAVAEADHYVATAQLGPGNIIPVLDLEERTSLPAPVRIDWAMAWLQEVKRKLHVHPMVYSGPNFWQTYMDDTTVIAEAGYPLWLAHWTSGTPTVPGGNWAGHGWTVWQWASCGSVRGMTGCVDQDRLNGLRLSLIRIPLLTVDRTPSGSVSSAPRGIDCGTRCSSVFDPRSSVGLAATPSLGAVLVRWGGSCSDDAACTVTMAGNRVVRAVFGYTLSVEMAGPGVGAVTSSPAGVACPDDCGRPFAEEQVITLSASAQAGSEFAGWSGDCTGSAECSLTMEQARTVTATFADDTAPAVELRPPRTLTGVARARFSEVVQGVTTENIHERLAGGSAVTPASLNCRDAAGSSTDCSTGDVREATVRPSGFRVPGQQYVLEANPSGADPIVDRGGNPAVATVTTFRAATAVEDSSPAVKPRWRRVWNPRAMGHSYTVEHLAGARASYGFTGSSVTWYTVVGRAFGEAVVRIDGVTHGRFNLYAPSSRYGVARSFTGLGSGPHRITIMPAGRAGAKGGGTAVAVDGFRVHRELDPSPVLSLRWAASTAQRASGGSYSVADLAGASIRLRFRGTAVDWVTVLGPGHGRAAVSVDRVQRAIVDGYAPTQTFGVVKHIGSLTDTVHVLRIVVLGTKRAASHGTSVALDAFRVT